MKVRITYPNGQQVVYHRVVDACVTVMELYRNEAPGPLGKPCTKNLMAYTDRVIVEKIDHAVYWTPNLIPAPRVQA